MFDPLAALGYNLKKTQQSVRHAMDKALMKLDLTAPQYSALTQLADGLGLSNAELARRCFVTPQSMHQLTGGLEARGFIKRSQHPEHGRIIQMGITETGSELLEEAHTLVHAVEAKMTQNVSTIEKQQVSRILEKCRVALEDEDEMS